MFSLCNITTIQTILKLYELAEQTAKCNGVLPLIIHKNDTQYLNMLREIESVIRTRLLLFKWMMKHT